MNNIINVGNINQLPINYLNSLSTYNNKLNISFDNNSSQVINSFFLKIKNVNNKNLYIESNDYSFQLDLLETTRIQNNFDIYLWFVECIRVANQIISSKSNTYITLFGSDINDWKISICNDIMFNYPFTLDDIIFFPISYIISEYNLNNLNKLNKLNKLIKSKKIINTLIHEKIHIAQRKNELVWEKFIDNENDNKWKKILSNTKEFEIINLNTTNNVIISNIKYNFILNPDTTYDNFKYVWIDDNNILYYGQYLYNVKTKKIEKKFFQIDLENKKLIPSNIDLNEEHPYEIYAYKIANHLTNDIIHSSLNNLV